VFGGGAEMIEIIERIVCALAGHKYKTIRILDPYARKVGCTRCGQIWAMHYPTQSFVPWDADLENVYSDSGPLGQRVQ